MIIYSEVFQNRRILLLYTLACLIFFCVGYFYMVNAAAISSQCNPMRELCFDNPLVYQNFGKVLVGIFGLCFLSFAYMLIRPFRIFYLTDDGFWTKDYGFISWDDVNKLYIDNLVDRTVIFFKVKETTKLKLALSKKIISYFKKGDLYIDLSLEYNEVNEVFKLMRTRCHIISER